MVTEYQVQDALDYVWRSEQSGMVNPEADRRHLMVLAGEVVRIQQERDKLADWQRKAGDAIDNCLDELAGV